MPPTDRRNRRYCCQTYTRENHAVGCKTGEVTMNLPLTGVAERLDRYMMEIEAETKVDGDNDPVNHPSHYTDVVPGIECIEVTQHFSFLRGNAIKYLWRAGAKGNKKQDLEKAMWYIQKELDSL